MKNLSVTALVLGIVSIATAVISMFVLPYIVALIAIGTGIAGIVVASKAKKAEGASSQVTAGLVLAIIGLCIGGLCFLTCGLCSLCVTCAACAGQNAVNDILNSTGDIEDILSSLY